MNEPKEGDGVEKDAGQDIRRGTLKEEELEDELSAFVRHCRKRALTQDEVDKLSQPLFDAVTKAKMEAAKRCLFKWIIFFTSVFIIYSLLQTTWTRRILQFVARIFLIKILPFWDWTRLYRTNCLLENPSYVPRGVSHLDCNVCESLDDVDSLKNMSVQRVLDEFVSNDLPFVVTDAMLDWLAMGSSSQFWFDNVTEVYADERLSNAKVCELSSNFRIGKSDLRALVKRIYNPNIQRWYGHWENCNKNAAKAFRSLYERPYFLENIADLSAANWAVISSNYRGRFFKELDIQAELAIIAQLKGWNKIKISPKSPCSDVCSDVIVNLTEGQILVLTTFLWKFKYIPGEDTDNIAIVVGGYLD